MKVNTKKLAVAFIIFGIPICFNFYWGLTEATEIFLQVFGWESTPFTRIFAGTMLGMIVGAIIGLLIGLLVGIIKGIRK